MNFFIKQLALAGKQNDLIFKEKLIEIDWACHWNLISGLESRLIISKIYLFINFLIEFNDLYFFVRNFFEILWK